MKDQATNVVRAVQKSWKSRDHRVLLVEKDLIIYEVDIVAGEQADKAKGIYKVSQGKLMPSRLRGLLLPIGAQWNMSMSDVRVSLSDNIDRGQSKTSPSKSVPEVFPTDEGEAARVDDAHLEVLPSMDINPEEVRGTLGVSTTTGPTTFVSSFKAVIMVVFVFATLAVMAADVSAQTIEMMAPAPAPSMATGAGFSLLVSGSIIGFSLFFSLLAIIKH
ncbi:hypothetical protein EZV62_005409 [Acer yangbiense]|uniref:Uncharacterized protein n=1 Tax=Acer yangbiense TaxID=1000413 RepID=A0A5C7INN6_9ROSI|nr:hypothetical protein EZV62_005409 [Acer yangbiense]